MKGIIHVVGQGYREFWIDGKDVTRMEKSWLDFRNNGQTLNIFYENGDTREIDGAITVEILEATAKTIEIMPSGEKIPSPQDELLDRKLCDLSLKVRTLNILHDGKIETVRDLVRLHKTDVLRLRNSGKKTLGELDDFIEDHNLNWGMDV
jgi:hypothetical protein